MYNDLVDMSMIAAPGMQWDAYNPKSDRVDNEILTTNARVSLKMIVRNLQPLRHETTFSMETALLLYTLISNRCIHLGGILNKSMYQDTSAAPPAPTEAPSCTNLFKKLLKKLHWRKKDLWNTQYMIRIVNPRMKFPNLVPVSSSGSDNEDYN
ncbi:hypothetical protein PIB30_078277 [Stylosanthes scabra]|uniref:Uncharacterized protein n=1 Tax=Stylosanthes scabra TaxID=79078 RepID=A0ABU6XNR2_9FABA|nr:hypothetical protein [Stylosanthes scabra]